MGPSRPQQSGSRPPNRPTRAVKSAANMEQSKRSSGKPKAKGALSKRPQPRTQATKLQASAATWPEPRRPARAPAGEITIPKRWVKVVVGVFLLPVAWVLSKTFFGVLIWATWEQQFWQSMELWFFVLGASIWLLIFYVCPRPMWLYVFGHELTHAMTVVLMGGKVFGFRARSDGGYVLTDKVNTWIALSPYFIPLYSVLVFVIYFGAGLFWDMEPFYPWMLSALGFTWTFHLTFTCLMIPKGQTDLTYGGNFFSLVIIYVANLLLLSILFVLGSQEVSAQFFASELFSNTQTLWEWADRWVRASSL